MTTTPSCLHRWLLPSLVRSPSVLGVCRRCGATREFLTDLPRRDAAPPRPTP
jgi:hypothetical protein